MLHPVRLWMSNTSIAGRLRKDGIIALTQPRSAKPLSETATWSNAGLNMTSLPEMRDLARRLLAYEAVAGKTSESKEAASLRVYEKLRQSLSALAGVAACEFPAGEGGIILIARLLGLLLTFLGEALTFSLLRNAWPGAAFDDRNSGTGRKA